MTVGNNILHKTEDFNSDILKITAPNLVIKLTFNITVKFSIFQIHKKNYKIKNHVNDMNNNGKIELIGEK